MQGHDLFPFPDLFCVELGCLNGNLVRLSKRLSREGEPERQSLLHLRPHKAASCGSVRMSPRGIIFEISRRPTTSFAPWNPLGSGEYKGESIAECY